MSSKSFKAMLRDKISGKGEARRRAFRKMRARFRRDISRRQGGIKTECGRVVACFWCGWWAHQSWLTVDHITRVADGGSKFALKNLALAHASCNNNRHHPPDRSAPGEGTA